MKVTISRALAGVGLAQAGQLQRLAEQVKRLENRVATLRAAAKTRNQRQAAAEVKALAWKKAAAGRGRSEDCGVEGGDGQYRTPAGRARKSTGHARKGRNEAPGVPCEGATHGLHSRTVRIGYRAAVSRLREPSSPSVAHHPVRQAPRLGDVAVASATRLPDVRPRVQRAPADAGGA